MLFEERKQESPASKKQVVIVIIIISFLLGGLGGSLSSYLLWQNAESLGFFQQDNGLKVKTIETEKLTLLEEESATIEVVNKATPSVVSIIISKEVGQIYNYSAPDFFNFGPFGFQSPQPSIPEEKAKEKREIGGGTGFIVSEDGYIVTNKHVVIDPEAEYEIITNDGEKYQAEIIAKDTINDLAVLKIEAENLTPLALGDSDNIQIGQTVIAIGNTLSEFRNTVTRGVISGINRRIEAGGSGFSEVIEEAIQTDAAINPGNSGGPLLNLKGEAIAINTAVSGSGQSIGFAIPINEAKRVVESIKEHGKIIRPFLGVRYMMLDKQIAKANNIEVDYGALILRGQEPGSLAVVPGSPADKAGLVENDIILEINGQKIDASKSLARALAEYNPGDEVELKILHDGEEKTVKAILVERQDN